jgi:hypothetical protein
VSSDMVRGDLNSPRITSLYWGVLIFKGFAAQRLYKSFGVKGLTATLRYFHKASSFSNLRTKGHSWVGSNSALFSRGPGLKSHFRN